MPETPSRQESLLSVVIAEVGEAASFFKTLSSHPEAFVKLLKNPRFWALVPGMIGLNVLLGGCNEIDDLSPTAIPSDLGGDGSDSVDTMPEVPHTTDIVITPAPNPTSISPEMVELAVGSPLPDWVGGEMVNSGDPGGLTAVRVDDNRPAVNALGMRGLVPVTDGGGVALSYEGPDGLHYFPLVPDIADRATGVTMKAEGVADENGVVTYVGDGAVPEQFLASMNCPDGVVCVQAVSYNEGDATVLYFVQVDQKGNILRYVTSGEAADAVSAGEAIPWIEGVSDNWNLNLSGEAALAQIGGLRAIEWDGDAGVFVFESGGQIVEAMAHEVTLTSDFGGIVQSDEGIFVWDGEAKDWLPAEKLPDSNGFDYELWKVGSRQFIFVGDDPRWVTNVEGFGTEDVVVTLDSGEKLVREDGEWANAVTAYTSEQIALMTEAEKLDSAPEYAPDGSERGSVSTVEGMDHLIVFRDAEGIATHVYDLLSGEFMGMDSAPIAEFVTTTGERVEMESFDDIQQVKEMLAEEGFLDVTTHGGFWKGGDFTQADLRFIANLKNIPGFMEGMARAITVTLQAPNGEMVKTSLFIFGIPGQGTIMEFRPDEVTTDPAGRNIIPFHVKQRDVDIRNELVVGSE